MSDNNGIIDNVSEGKDAELLRREQELKAIERELSAKSAMLDDKEHELADKEMSLERAGEVIKKRTAKLDDRDAALAGRELAFENELEHRRAEQEKDLADKRLSSFNDIAELRKKNLEELAADYAAKQREAMEFCENLKAKTQKECDDMRYDAEVKLSQWRSQQSKEYADALERERKLVAQEFSGNREELKASFEELNRQRAEFEKKKLKYEDDVINVEFEKLQLESDRKELKRQIDKQETFIEKKAAERERAVKESNAALEEQCRLLREQIEDMKSRCESADTLEKTLGLSAKSIQKLLADNKNRIKELENMLAAAPSSDLPKTHEHLKKDFEIVCSQKNELERKNADLITAAIETGKLEAEIKQQIQENENLRNLIEIHEMEIKRLNENIRRLQVSAVQATERNDRLRALFDLRQTSVKFNSKSSDNLDEIGWLENIRNRCKEIDMVFPKRIIYAFHTALKCADWSTVTVLAGVSGTGKSELPRLYSEIGGINFFSTAVQPNWDSQESMLGYFNSIDNRFDAQPLLRYLVRCTENFSEAGLSELKNELEASGFVSAHDCMSIALLDEMNLAHVEHYFADFLSKLEERRAKGRDYVPAIEVKLGAGIKPYNLRLSRNVLWIGTMNQDETTKSLSDKVLDRGIIINFPRPKKLKERTKLESLDKKIKEWGIPALRKKTWDNWMRLDLTKRSNAEADEMKRFKKIVEDINERLAYAGRALGHRVWQAIDYYVANYPEVIAESAKAEGQLTPGLKKAMNIAFEDQIVQKIMPKLRGIETRGNSRKKCLDGIKEILDENGFGNLCEDFDNACELGYGQFMWCTANYIDADKETSNETPADNAE